MLAATLSAVALVGGRPAGAHVLIRGGYRSSRLLLSSNAPPPAPHVIAEIQVLPCPTGTLDNKFSHVEAAIARIASSGLKHSVNALSTTFEGPADEVWATARSAFDACLESGAEEEMMMLKIYQGGREAAQLEASGQATATAAATASADGAADATAVSASVAEAIDAAPEEPPRSRLIHPGSRDLPPLMEVPGGLLPLRAVVKPPDVDVLWQWEESRGNLDADPSWASVWPAAANLASLIAANANLVAGKRVVELGAGLGVAGLTAASVGARSVTLIDREALALHCAMSSAEVCGLQTGPVPDGSPEATAFYERKEEEGVDGGSSAVVSASVLDWGDVADDGLVADVVLAAEVLYDPCEAAPLARSAAKLLREGGTLLLSDPAAGRIERARSKASDALRQLGATVSERPLASAPAGDGWYSLRAGDGRTSAGRDGGSAAGASEPVVLLCAEFGKPPRA
jgi:predicted nicotinamide N-methyase/uncharacterized protein YqgV (UPF0045/DUF77 family)